MTQLLQTPDITVEQFRDAWIKAKCPIRPPFRQPVFFTDSSGSLCLFRQGKFQVELYISEPNSSSPPHYHPGVDSCFIYLTGNIQFNLQDTEQKNVKDLQYANAKGNHILFGQRVSSPDGIPHWLTIGKEGGAFLSFEKWKDKEPTSVTINWAGEEVGDAHKLLLEELANNGTDHI